MVNVWSILQNTHIFGRLSFKTFDGAVSCCVLDIIYVVNFILQKWLRVKRIRWDCALFYNQYPKTIYLQYTKWCTWKSLLVSSEINGSNKNSLFKLNVNRTKHYFSSTRDQFAKLIRNISHHTSYKAYEWTVCRLGLNMSISNLF